MTTGRSSSCSPTRTSGHLSANQIAATTQAELHTVWCANATDAKVTRRFIITTTSAYDQHVLAELDEVALIQRCNDRGEVLRRPQLDHCHLQLRRFGHRS